jgi:translation initiation factor IF-1
MRAADGKSGVSRAGGRPLQATVAAVLPNARFTLRLEDGSERTAHVAGDLRMGFTRLLPGDVVQIELSPLDPDKARITAITGTRAPRGR